MSYLQVSLAVGAGMLVAYSILEHLSFRKTVQEVNARIPITDARTLKQWRDLPETLEWKYEELIGKLRMRRDLSFLLAMRWIAAMLLLFSFALHFFQHGM